MRLSKVDLRRQKVEKILTEIAKAYRLDLLSMRVKPHNRKIRAARREFMRKASEFAGAPTIADILHCDETTVRYHVSARYKARKRASNDRWMARQRSATRENHGAD